MRGEDGFPPGFGDAAAGSPPHARGRLAAAEPIESVLGITPACAGKTSARISDTVIITDHPRMRGEDILGSKVQAAKPWITPACAGKTAPHALGPAPRPGSPPHARGRPAFSALKPSGIRITPACAGKTFPYSCRETTIADHPRMRGEDVGFRSEGEFLDGITPACAGKTKYDKRYANLWKGSPPHARGRRGQQYVRVRPVRITPACAGKTWGMLEKGEVDGDHPRMRGEDLVRVPKLARKLGSPPHARGRPAGQPPPLKHQRITPACAGKTGILTRRPACPWDHPRMRGED